MPLKLTKDTVSLLTAIITEICNDSDEDDFIPMQAVEEGFHCDGCKKSPPRKKQKNYTPKEAKPKSKYVVLSRFENESIVKQPFSNSNIVICKTTLKPTEICFCAVHLKGNKYIVNHYQDYKFEFPTDGADLKAYTKMKRTTIEIIFKICNSDEAKFTPLQFLIVLWRLTTNDTLKELSDRFKTSIEEIPNLITSACDVIVNKRFEFEKWPQGESAYATMASFKAICGFPRVLAVVSSVHFPCDGMPYSGTFVNTNNDKTAVFELGCDHRGSFIYSSYFWWPGKWLPADIQDEANLNSLPIPEGAYFLANSCYSQFPYFVTPFRNAKLNTSQSKFNESHNKAMQILPNSVFQLISRFYAARCLPSQRLWVLRKLFGSIVVLHNLCLELDDVIETDPDLKEETFFPTPIFVSKADEEAELRKEICLQMSGAGGKK